MKLNRTDRRGEAPFLLSDMPLSELDVRDVRIRVDRNRRSIYSNSKDVRTKDVGSSAVGKHCAPEGGQ
ncbi:hypothetical protein GCM10020370_31970 [Paenibacillus hodogayensis]